MKKISLKRQTYISKDIKPLLMIDSLRETVEKELIESLSKEISKVLKSKEGKELLNLTVDLSNEDYEIHELEITLANTRDLKNLCKSKKQLEEENKHLKEKVKLYESMGLLELIDIIEKVEMLNEFLEIIHFLTREYEEKIKNK